MLSALALAVACGGNASPEDGGSDGSNDVIQSFDAAYGGPPIDARNDSLLGAYGGPPPDAGGG